MKKYTVWVDGTEVNDYLLTKKQAQLLAAQYINDNYENVIIEKVL